MAGEFFTGSQFVALYLEHGLVQLLRALHVLHVKFERTDRIICHCLPPYSACTHSVICGRLDRFAFRDKEKDFSREASNALVISKRQPTSVEISPRRVGRACESHRLR